MAAIVHNVETRITVFIEDACGDNEIFRHGVRIEAGTVDVLIGVPIVAIGGHIAAAESIADCGGPCLLQ